MLNVSRQPVRLKPNFQVHVQTLSVRRKVDSLSDDKVTSNMQRNLQNYTVRLQHAKKE